MSTESCYRPHLTTHTDELQSLPYSNCCSFKKREIRPSFFFFPGVGVIGKMCRGLKRLPFYSARGRDRNEMNELLGFVRHSPSPLQHHMGIWPCHVSDSSLGVLSQETIP